MCITCHSCIYFYSYSCVCVFTFSWLNTTLKNQSFNYSFIQIRGQINAFFFILELYFRGVVASVRDCLYLLIYSVLFNHCNFAEWNVTGYSCRFLRQARHSKIARRRAVLYPEKFGIGRCPLRAKCICILANSKMCWLQQTSFFAASTSCSSRGDFPLRSREKLSRHEPSVAFI